MINRLILSASLKSVGLIESKSFLGKIIYPKDKRKRKVLG